VADVDLSWWAEKGVLTIEGVQYSAYREGWMRGDFLLERNGSVIARAEKPSAFLRKYLIRYADREYMLGATSAFGRKFALLSGSREIGSITPVSCFRRGATADLPDTLPLHLRAFIIWLTMVQWRRERNG
jgi:hypothetical protein